MLSVFAADSSPARRRSRPPGRWRRMAAFPPTVAGTGAVLASLASALVNLPILARVARQPHVTRRVGRALAWVLSAGIIGVALEWCFRRLC